MDLQKPLKEDVLVGRDKEMIEYFSQNDMTFSGISGTHDQFHV